MYLEIVAEMSPQRFNLALEDCDNMPLREEIRWPSQEMTFLSLQYELRSEEIKTQEDAK